MGHGRAPLHLLALSLSTLALAPAAASAATNVCATVESDPVHHALDAADDAAVWINPANPAASAFIGADKQTGGGLASTTSPATSSASTPTSASTTSTSATTSRSARSASASSAPRTATTAASTSGRSTRPTRTLSSVGSVAMGAEAGAGRIARGFALYHSPVSGKYYAFVTDSGHTWQYELDGSSGQVKGTFVRELPISGVTEGLVADDEHARVYVAVEDIGGIDRWGAEPGDPKTPVRIDKTTEAGGHIVQDVKGLSMYYASGGAGYLIAASQGGDTFHVYDRVTNAWKGEFHIADCAANGTDKVTAIDGQDVTNVNLGPAFPEGAFIAQDDSNATATGLANQNYKLVPWGDIARKLGLTIDTTFNPRTIGALGSPTPLPTPTPIPSPGPGGTPPTGSTPGPAPGPQGRAPGRARRPGSARRHPGSLRPPPRRPRARPDAHGSARLGVRHRPVQGAQRERLRRPRDRGAPHDRRPAPGQDVRFTVVRDRAVTMRLSKPARALLRRGARKVELALTLRDPAGTVRGAWVTFRLRAAAAPLAGSPRARIRGPAGLEPAALGGDEDGLGAVDRAELAVDVVQVRADRARRERQLVRDLLVDLALGEALEHLALARGQRRGVDLAGAAARRVGQVVEDAAQVLGAHADGAGDLEQLGRGDGAALRVVGEHVGQPDEGGLAGGVLGVVALDDGGDGLRQAPAAGEDAADQRVVDAELAALAVDALLRRARLAVDPATGTRGRRA